MNIENYINIELTKVPGWCCAEKAKKMYDLITLENLQLCVEIGVFGGSSFFPQAIAMSKKKSGFVFGVDPWSTDCALEDMTNEANKNWWSSLDLNSIYSNFLKTMTKYGVNNFCKIFRDKSSNVVSNFEDNTIDMLHIDGNHCERLALEDAVFYLPKVKSGGYIFFDDTTWIESGTVASTQKGLLHIQKSCKEIAIIGKDCLLLQKI